jgi:hypothetical protein
MISLFPVFLTSSLKYPLYVSLYFYVRGSSLDYGSHKQGKMSNKEYHDNDHKPSLKVVGLKVKFLLKLCYYNAKEQFLKPN